MRRNRASLLAEIEAIIEAMPPQATIRHPNEPENVEWFGRVAAAIEKWNPSKSNWARECIELFFNNRHAREAATGLTSLKILLNQAKAELQAETENAPSDSINMEKKIFIGHGRSTVW